VIECLFIGNESLLVRCGDMARASGLRIVLVVTESPAVASWAEAAGVSAQPFVPEVASSLGPGAVDYVFSVGNLHVLTAEWLALARREVVNFHDGPLPEYRGLHVTTWALMNREPRHGVTWHLAAAAVDRGDIVEEERFAVSRDETALTLNARCFEAGAAAFGRLIAAICGPGVVARPPNPGAPSRYYAAARRPPGAGAVDWSRPVEECEALIRALDFGAYPNPLCSPWAWRSSSVVRVDMATVARVRAGTECFDPLPVERLADLSARHEAWCGGEAAWIDRLRAALPLPWPDAPELEGAPDVATGALDAGEPFRVAAAVLVWLARTFEEPAFDVSCRGPALDRALAGLEPWFESLPPLRVAVALDEPFSTAVDSVAAALVEHDRRGSFLHDVVHRYPDLRGRAERAGPGRLGVAITIGDDRAASDDRRAALVIHVAADGSRCEWRGDPRRIPAPVDVLQRRCATFLRAAAATPSAAVAQLPQVAGDERQRLVDAARGPLLPSVPFRAWPEWFVAQAAATPEATAVVSRRARWTYRDLESRAGRIAAALGQAGVGRGSIVALHVDRSAEMLAALVGIARAGAAYLPLDPAYPAARLAYMLEDSGAALVLTRDHLDVRWLEGAVPAVSIDAVLGAEATPEAQPAGGGIDAGDLAYLIYTSGSTGRPKGVMVDHGNVASFFAAMDRHMALTRPATWLAVTSLSFDISVLELLWTISRGVTVVVGDQPGAMTPPQAPPPVTFSLFYFAADDDDQVSGRYRLLIEGARFADRHGFEAVWTPERHFHAFGGLYPNPAVTSAAVAAVTERVHVRAGSVVLPLHHPARVAEDWSLVDNLSNGRAGVAFASGWHPGDFVFAPDRHADAKAVTFELLDVVRRLWRGESVRLPGPRDGEVEVRTRPRPIQADLPFWITTAGNPETFRRAGQSGGNVLTHLLGQTVEQVAANIRIYRQARHAAGHAAPGRVTLMVHTFVGDGDAEVRELVRSPMKRYLGSALDLVKPYAWSFPAFKAHAGAASVPTEALFRGVSEADLDALLDHAFERYFEHGGLFGSLDTCASAVDRFRAAGVDEIACLIDFGVAADRVLAALEPLARLRERSAAAQPSIADTLTAHGVTHLQCTPSLAELLVAEPAGRAALGRLRHLLVGGEALSAPLAARLLATGAGRVTNMYGPTETTVWSLAHDLVAEEAPVPIGRPIAGTRAYVCDSSGELVPSGSAGELYLGGPGVARGYYRQPELTASRFVADRFDPAGGSRLYRTGDRVRRRRDGAFEFLGRTDQQVKLRGYRLELGEVEAALHAVPGVSAAAAVVREDTPGDRRLIGYVTAVPGAAVGDDVCRSALAARLPAPMVPAAVVVLDALPTTPNGKIDRRLLPPPSPPAPARPPSSPPATDLQRTVAAIWRDLLDVSDVGLDDNFFDLGGHSLLTLQVAQRLGAVVGRPLPITDLFRHPTVRTLAAHVSSGMRDDDGVRAAASERAARRLAARRQGR